MPREKTWLEKAREYETLVRLLRQAQRELDSLYSFALNHGVHEAGDPLHRQIKQYLKEIEED